MIAEVEIDLSDFSDDELLNEVSNRITWKADFLNELKKMIPKQEKEELEEFEPLAVLYDFTFWLNQKGAKKSFEAMKYSKEVKEWILKTYAGE